MIDIPVDKKIKLPGMGSWPKTVHVFDETSKWAIMAALNSQRPLLIRGEPGAGKSQLARAAAKMLNRAFIAEVVHSGSECKEFQYEFDSVARLGEAQALVAGDRRQKVDEILDPLNFLIPGSLWWTFNWKSAEEQCKKCKRCKECTGCRGNEKPDDWSPEKGCVLLIDEIDKADADLPNGLLETLGNGAFTVPYMKKPIIQEKGAEPPLVVITTNEERELPYAFLRRCMVLHMKLPEEKNELTAWLIRRGEVHFGDVCEKKVLEETAELLCNDRATAISNNLPKPGQAEYLDILRALSNISSDSEEQSLYLKKINQFALKKHSDR